MVDINNNKTRAEQLIIENAAKASRSEELLRKRAVSNSIPELNPRLIRGVSDERRALMELQIEAGEFREAGTTIYKNQDPPPIPMVQTQAGVVTHSGSLSKFATTGSVSGSSSGWRGSNDTVRQVPEVYSPLWLNSNLNLPRDRTTINAWSRTFFALNPMVHNAVNLHSTYPISKLNIKAKDPKVAKFFSEMIEEIDLMNICVMAAQEYWTLGEAFIFAELDENKGRWSRLMILNPDYVNVQRSVIAAEPIISLIPDENLKRVVFGNQPSDIQQKQQLDPSIIEHVRKNQNIPLNNFYVHHMARRISPYEIRGTGLVVSCFRALMLLDKLKESKFAQADNFINPLTLIKIGDQDFRPTPVDLENWRNVFECYDDETEVLTNDGFKLFKDVIDYHEENGTIISKPKEYVTVACFNPVTEELEYHKPIKSYVNNYNGEMYHFHNEKIDVKVTPDHDMWVSEKIHHYNPKGFYWGEFKKKKAKDLNVNDYNKFRSVVNWKGNDIKYVEIDNYKVPIELYLELLGYILSEGCCYTNGKSQYTVSISQKVERFYEKMKFCLTAFANCFGKKIGSRIKPNNFWNGVISGKEIFNHFHEQISSNGNTYSYNKKIPRWVLDLNPSLLSILLEAMVDGDGLRVITKNGFLRMNYATTSKQLADDVQEIVLKCGYSSLICKKIDKRPNRLPTYNIQWSNSGKGDYPLVYKQSRNSATKKTHSTFDIEPYNGKIWCFTVPTGLFITRRNSKITIQGNSAAFDKNFKIFTHNAVTVEPIGFGGAIYNTNEDINQLIKEIYVGLMVPSVVMDGSDTSYATGSVALDVLRQRYMQFRQMMTTWLKRKIFAPIAQINDFYDYVDGEKTLQVPEIDWNHMSLFDMDSYINNLVNLSQGEGTAKRVSLQSLYRSLGLEYEEEQRKIKYENLQNVIMAREMAAMSRYSLHELKALKLGDQIEEPIDEPVPGESPYEQIGGSTQEEPNYSSSTSGSGLGAMPGAPPPAPIGSTP
jgi:hypothetical protein